MWDAGGRDMRLIGFSLPPASRILHPLLAPLRLDHADVIFY